MPDITFGIYRGRDFKELPDDYLQWVAKPVYSGKFYKNSRTMDKNWRVPFEARAHARKELERRGFKLIGERWEKIMFYQLVAVI